MNKSLISSEVEMEEQEQTPPSASWGRRLRTERESRNLSIEDISSELRLETHLIQEIEDEDIDRLPSAPFVKGYLRSYARLLGIDEKRIIDGYSQLGIEDAPGIRKLDRVHEATSKHAGARVATWVVVAVVLASAVAWLWSQMTSPPKPEEMTISATTETEVVTPTGGISTQVIVNDPIPFAPASDVEAVIESPITTKDVVVDEPAEEATLVGSVVQAEMGIPPVGFASVTLSFSAESWVEIEDARGERLFVNIGKPDTERTVEGMPPFSVLLGNAPVVTLSYNGKPYDHVRHNRKGVARFTLGEAVSE
ncbi:helix-turn-helix domain-containing protein [Pseudomonadota bacterium]